VSVSSISFNLFIIKDERGNLNVKLKNSEKILKRLEFNCVSDQFQKCMDDNNRSPTDS
jgi:hypothetical protein